MYSRLLPLLAAAAAVSISGCGGGGGGDPQIAAPPPPPANASPGGIWEGTTSDGDQLLGLVTETGEFHFISDEGVQYFGTLNVSVNSVTASFTGVTPFPLVFQDGSASGSGSLTGNVQERASMTGTSTFTTANGSTVNTTLNLTYNNLYERDSSLAIAAGNYRQFGTNDIVSVNGNGEAFMQEAGTGCVINGNVSVIDARFNAYRVQYTYSNCLGQFSVLNGREFRGLATLDNTASPEAMIVGAVTTSGTPRLSVVLLFERM